MSAPSLSPVILWFRKDLRLDDNLALQAAVASGQPVVPVYICEPAGLETGPLGAAQSWWLHHSLLALRASLRELGSELLFLSGDPLAVITQLVGDTGADTVFWNRRHDPAGVSCDIRLKQRLRDQGLHVESFAGQLLHEPTKLLTGAGGPYRVYTPFWRALEASGEPREPVDAPTKLIAPKRWPRSDTIDHWKLLPTKPNWASTFTEIWTPGEAAALEKLEDFTESALSGYKQARDFPATPATSLLSPHLALGEISPYRIWHATRGLSGRIPTDDVIHFRKELVWRDFSYHLIVHCPELPHANWNSKFDAFPWSFDSTMFDRWTGGRTGYPIVDAGMRQLWRHGWMHNRVRMIVASFLIKDLLIDWRHGERWFRDTLVDADPAANAASWQWVAGSGADASPFFRVFNPILQGEKFDPDGSYVRAFVPELAGMSNKFIHRPFEAPDAELIKAGVTLGDTYPQPIVNHATARNRALSAYGELKNAV